MNRARSPFKPYRDQIINDSHVKILVNEKFPDNWSDLIEFIKNDVQNLVKKYNKLVMDKKDLFDLYREYLEGKNGKHLSPESHVIYHESLVNNFEPIWKNYHPNIKFSAKDLSKDNLLRIRELSTPPYNYNIKGISYFFNFIKNLLSDLFPIPLNQILYGPPGTGKTYKTKEIAVEIIDGEVPESREELTERYEELKEKRQIRFTTFHQSMSYEDFVEGIKPKINEENNNEIEYEVKDGIFKEICELAAKKETTNFNESYENLIRDISEYEYLILKTPRGKEFRVNINSNDNLNLYTTSEIKKQGVLSMQKLEKYYQGEKVFKGWEGYAIGVLEYLKDKYNLSKEAKKTNQKYILIIDEINRGNISAIFGELITLLEEDKRAGKEEAIEAILPYSRDEFSVPDNLYIIGTMNTADRSVEALDTALRRRFAFEEMMPDATLLENEHETTGIIREDEEEISLVKLLEAINERIELLKDKDHQIGHSYFFDVKTFEDLKVTFKDKIIPLLEEYFYGDFGKIGLVLGDSFVKLKENKNKTIWANFDYETDFIEGKELYDFTPFNEWSAKCFQSVYLNSTSEDEQ